MLLRLSGSYAVVLDGPAMGCKYKRMPFAYRSIAFCLKAFVCCRRAPCMGFCDLAGWSSGPHKLPEIALERGSKHPT